MSVARFIVDQRTPENQLPDATHDCLCPVRSAPGLVIQGGLRATVPSAPSGLHTPRIVAVRSSTGRCGRCPSTSAGCSARLAWFTIGVRRASGSAMKTVANPIRRQGLTARRIRRHNCLTGQDKIAPKFPHLPKRAFTADRPKIRWASEMKEVPTADEHGWPGPNLNLASVIDLYPRRLLDAATRLRPEA